MLSGTSRYLSLLHGEKKHCVDSENGTCKPHTTVSYAHPHCPVCSCCCRHTTHSLLVSVSVSRCRPPPVVHVPESAPSLVVSQKYIYSVAPWTFFPRINIYLLLPQTAPHLSSPHFALSSTPTYPSWSSIPLSCPDHSLAPRFPPRLTLARAHLLTLLLPSNLYHQVANFGGAVNRSYRSNSEITNSLDLDLRPRKEPNSCNKLNVRHALHPPCRTTSSATPYSKDL
jgi:hypothetical protein